MNKILVTGGSGFIGTNLIEHYKSIGDEVFNIDINQPRNIEHLDQWRKVDLLDKDKLTSVIKEIEPNIVFHMAARTDLNGLNVGNYDVNTRGVENLIGALNELTTLDFVIFASSMLVCRLGYKPSSEVDYCPNTPYGRSKVIGEELIRSSNINFPWVIVRPTSIWGPWFATPYRDFFDVIRKGLYVHPKGIRVRRSYGFIYNSIFQLSRISDRLNDELVGKTIYLADYHPIELKSWSENIQKNLNIHIGCQIQINGNAINHNRIFLPFQTNSGILNCLYYNLEHIITQNLVSFSESSDQYLKITDRTILRELESTISRLKVKVNTRKKLLKDLVHQDQFNFIGNDSGFPQVNLKIAKDLYSATIAGFPQESFASDVITANIPTFGIHSKKEDQNISDADSIPENDSKVDYPEIEKSSEEIQFDKKKVEAINFHPNEDDFERRKQSKRNYVPHPFKENLKANSFKRRKSDWQEKLPNRISKTVDMD